MYFGRKRVETGPNFLYELATFLKYHMPLSINTLRLIKENRRYSVSSRLLDDSHNCVFSISHAVCDLIHFYIEFH